MGKVCLGIWHFWAKFCIREGIFVHGTVPNFIEFLGKILGFLHSGKNPNKILIFKLQHLFVRICDKTGKIDHFWVLKMTKFD